MSGAGAAACGAGAAACAASPLGAGAAAAAAAGSLAGPAAAGAAAAAAMSLTGAASGVAAAWDTDNRARLDLACGWLAGAAGCARASFLPDWVPASASDLLRHDPICRD